jgi:serine O-acetyltransferase
LAYLLLKLLGAEVPPSVQIGPGCLLVHGGFGVVIHPSTRLGQHVKIYPGVTLGRSDIHRPADRSEFAGFEIGDGVILSPGAKVLGKSGIVQLGPGTIVGANAVLLESTGPNEIWAGIPARCVGHREPV